MSNMPVSREKMDTFKGLVESRRDAIQAMLPKHLSAERICRVAIMAASRNPLLLECDQASIVRAVMTASQLGLEPGSPIGGAHLVPFRNGRTGKHEAQLIIDYRGLIDLARRSGNIVSIEAHVVHKADRFTCQFGLDAKLEHEPSWTAEDPGPMVAVYAVAKLKDGGEQAEVMTRAQVDAIRKRSRASDGGPWVTDYDEMARKTVVKRLC